MFEDKSKRFSISWYDIYASLRSILLFILSGLIANMSALEKFASENGVPSVVVLMGVWYVLDLGRRFLRDNTK